MNLSCGLLHRNIILEWPQRFYWWSHTIKDESAKLCFISIIHVVCYIFPPGNVELDIVLNIHYDEPVKVPLMLLVVQYGKILNSGMDSMQI